MVIIGLCFTGVISHVDLTGNCLYVNSRGVHQHSKDVLLTSWHVPTAINLCSSHRETFPLDLSQHTVVLTLCEDTLQKASRHHCAKDAFLIWGRLIHYLCKG